jgi:hypothetical protein
MMLQESQGGSLRTAADVNVVAAFFQRCQLEGSSLQSIARRSVCLEFWRKKMHRLILRAMLIATVLVALSSSLLAQQTGNIVGTVVDPTGAVISQAKVTLINAKTGDVRATTSNGEGFFAFSSTQAADYSVKVEAQGFRPAELSGIHISPGDRRDLTVSLAVGTESASVTVVAAGASEIKVDSGDLSSTLSSTDIGNLAIQGRDVTELLKTMPGFSMNTSYNGVQNKAGYSSTVTSIQSSVGNGISAPGAPDRSGGADLVSDGAHILDPGCACNANQTVNPDMVAEVKVTTSAYGADSMSGPVVISAVGKSGSSDYHGGVYLNFRDRNLNSNDWYFNHLKQARPNDRYWYPGGQVGGPVPFTHKKLTFFGGFEDYQQRFPDGTSTGLLKAMVPTVSERAGHFDPTIADNAAMCSAIAGWVASQYRCQPITSISTRNGYVSGIQNSDVSAYLAPGAAAWMKLIPQPNHVPTSSENFNYVSPLIDTNNGYMGHAKFDYAFSENTKASMSLNQQHENYSQPVQRWWLPADSIATPGNPQSSTISRTIAGSLVKVFNSTTTNEFLAGLSFMNSPVKFGDPKALDRDALGFPYKYPGLSPIMPSLQNSWWNSDMGVPMMMDNGRIHYFSRKMQPSISDNFTKVFRTHTVKAGVSWMRSGNRQANVDQGTGGSLGQIAYGPIWDYSSPDGSQITSSYNPVLDLMLDHAGNFTYLPDTIADMKDDSIGFYGQDEWKINKRVSINYGLRITHDLPWQDVTGKFGAAAWTQDWYDADVAKGITALPGMRWHAKDNAIPLAGHSMDSIFYAPRFGVALDAYGNGKTVFRGGLGVYYYHDNLAGYDAATGTSMGGTSCNLTSATFLSAVDAGTNVQCANTGSGVTSATAVDFTDHTEPRTLNYNFTLSQQTAGKSLLEISYLGSQSIDLINPLGNVNIMPIGAYAKPDPNPASSNFGKLIPIGTISSNSGNVVQDFYPLTHYTNLNLIRHGAWSNYNSLQVVWTKSQGPLTYNLNYTWSKTLGINGTEDPVNIENDYGILGQDHTHVFNASYSYETRHQFNRNKLAGAALNGWTVSGILNLQSGINIQQGFSKNLGLGGNNTLPTDVHTVNTTYYLGTANYTLQPKLTCNPAAGRKGGALINASCFSLPADPQFQAVTNSQGNVDYYLTDLGGQGQYQMPYMRGPAFFQTDLSFSRTVKITERQNVMFRIEGLNFLNHPLESFDQNNANNLNLNYTNGVLKTSDTGWNYGVPNEKFGRRIAELTFKYNF